MSNNQEKGINVSSCSCPSTGRGRDLIVITIETGCRRKDCPAYKKKSEQSTKTITSDERGDGDDILPPPEVETLVPPPDKKDSSPSPTKVRLSDESEEVSDVEDVPPAPPLSEEKEKTPTPPPQKRFKLPVLVERYHGPGCAMEISILEKHEDTCIYKKEGEEGRNTFDDRAGSYECIGRLVFRTCDSVDVDTDSSHGSQSINRGARPADKHPASDRFPPRPPSLSPPPSAVSSAPETAPKDEPKASEPEKEKSLSFVAEKEKPPSIVSERSKPPSISSEKVRSPSTLSQKSKPPSLVSEKSKSPSVTSPKEQQPSEAAESVSQYGSAASKEETGSAEARTDQKLREEHVMFARTAMIPNVFAPKKSSNFNVTKPDMSKIYLPRTPISVASNMEKVYSSKKIFPMYADESNQTENEMKERFSSETISSLADLSQAGKKRRGFFGTWFRKDIR